MELICLDGKKSNPNEKSTKGREDSTEEFKEASVEDINSSELEVKFQKICKKLPLTLNFITGKRSSRCCMESCSCGNDIDLPCFLCFLNANKNLGWYSIKSREYTDSVSRNHLHKTLSFPKFSLNFRLLEFISEGLIYHRKSRTINATNTIFPRRSLRGGTGNVAVSHSERWMFDAFQGNAKAIAYLKSLLFVQLGILDDVNLPRFKSRKPVLRTQESSSSLLLVDKGEMELLCKESSEATFSEMNSIFCPSVNSTFSSHSTLSTDTSITKGQLQYFQKGGMPCFVFSEDNAPQVTYMASPQKIEFSAAGAIDFMYSFYFNDTRNSNSRSHSSIPTNLIAKMKVSSSIVLKPNCVKGMETEFVLYGSPEKLSDELQKSFSVAPRTKVFSKKINEILRPRNMIKTKSKSTVNGQKLDGLGHINVSSLINDATDCLLPNLELAAIVVEDCLQYTTNDSMLNGWGLKFLEKSSQKDTSSEPPLPSCCSEHPGGYARSMAVIVPAGPHGGQVARNGGAASLLDRWRSGGRCDCGGWDLGCPLRVLDYSSIYSNVSSKDTEEKSINLFIEGKRNGGHPTLSMMKVTEGIYSISFRSPLSALQSFSIAVAVIHTKIADNKAPIL